MKLALSLAAIVVSVGLLSPLWAQEPQPPRPCLVASPTMEAKLPEGQPLLAILVIPCENILAKNAAWLKWESDWPTKYRLETKQAAE